MFTCGRDDCGVGGCTQDGHAHPRAARDARDGTYPDPAKRDFSKLREIALWMWGRGGVDAVEEPVKWFMKETGLKVALDWYWWHNVPYDTAYPFFWPPRDGEEAFCASVKRMKEAGAFVQGYTNGMLWDCDDPRWADGGLDSTLIRANGRVHSLVFNPYTKKRQAWMCGEAPILHVDGRGDQASPRDGAAARFWYNPGKHSRRSELCFTDAVRSWRGLRNCGGESSVARRLSCRTAISLTSSSPLRVCSALTPLADRGIMVYLPHGKKAHRP